MKIVVVAGGLATRMRPITEEIPKCLIDINGKPLIQHQLEFFKEHGYTEFIFNVAHLAEKVEEYFGDGSEFGLTIQYIDEGEELRGTAGSVKLDEDLITEDNFIVFMGDNLTSMDFDKFIEFHQQKGGVATICMRPLPAGYQSSSVITLHKDKRIKVFLEKPPMEEIEKYKDEKRFINSGIYCFKREVFKLIPPNTKYDFAKQLFPDIMKKKLGIYGYVTEEFFREIGRVEKYDAFLKEIRDKKKFL
ncbi:NDP-sugar synthase [Candidatus Woesearchaeota archaeon]|nr:NDP-sugar synthase [Candidatus Woesearchaeota archaeon]